MLRPCTETSFYLHHVWITSPSFYFVSASMKNYRSYLHRIKNMQFSPYLSAREFIHMPFIIRLPTLQKYYIKIKLFIPVLSIFFPFCGPVRAKTVKKRSFSVRNPSCFIFWISPSALIIDPKKTIGAYSEV